MKQIISYNEEYIDLCAVCVIPDDMNAAEAFRGFVRKRVSELLDITEKEADERMNAECDYAVNYNVYGSDASAWIDYGNYMEFIRMTDVPTVTVSELGIPAVGGGKR